MKLIQTINPNPKSRINWVRVKPEPATHVSQVKRSTEPNIQWQQESAL